MKKIVIIFFFVLFLFSFTGCENKTKESVDNMNNGLYTVSLNVEGMGQVAFAKEGEKLVFDDEYPVQSIQTEEEKMVRLTIGAKADDGYHFVKWVKNGEDFSTDEQTNVEINEDIDLIAVFE